MGRSDPNRPWEWLYGLTGTGMWSFTHARFDVQVVGSFPRVDQGDLWIAAHREETDVPVLAGLMYSRGGMWRPGAPRVHFAARDDLFTPGVIAAGLRLPRPVARLVWPMSPGPWLPRVRAHPVRRPTGAKLGQVLAAAPDHAPLAALLSDRLIALIATRTRALGRRNPTTAANLRSADFARILWVDVDGDDFPGPGGAALWRGHIAKAAGDVRRIVRLVRDREPLLLFPEGTVSPDGGIGPVGEILRVVATHGRPDRIVPIGLAYDPLHRGRVTIAVGAAPAIPAAETDLLDIAGARLRLATPITCGQVVARWLLRPPDRDNPPDLRTGLHLTVTRAHDEGRPVAQGLMEPGSRERHLGAALAALRARGIQPGDTGAGPDRARAHKDPQIVRLAVEDDAVWNRQTLESPPCRTR